MWIIDSRPLLVCHLIIILRPRQVFGLIAMLLVILYSVILSQSVSFKLTQLKIITESLAELGSRYSYDSLRPSRDAYESSNVSTIGDESVNDTSRVEEKAQQIESTEGYEI